MIRILPIVGTGLPDVRDASQFLQRPQDVLEGDVGWNIKFMISQMLVPCLQQTLSDLDAALLQSRAGLDLFDLFFKRVRDDRVDVQLRNLYGHVMASNFGLAMNATISLFVLMRSALTDVNLAGANVDRDLIAQLSENLESVVLSTGADLTYPMTIDMEDGAEFRDAMRSVVLSFNMIAFMSLVLLVVSNGLERRKLTKEQVSRLEQLLRDWTLDIMAQVDESLGVELGAAGPYDIGIPVTDEDRELVEAGLDDYLEHLE